VIREGVISTHFSKARQEQTQGESQEFHYYVSSSGTETPGVEMQSYREINNGFDIDRQKIKKCLGRVT